MPTLTVQPELPDLRKKLKWEDWEVRPRHGFILVTPVETKSVLALPAAAKATVDIPLYRVLAVGPGHWAATGGKLKIDLEEGDLVAAGSTMGQVGRMPLSNFEGDIYLMSDEAIAMVLKPKQRGGIIT